MNHIAKLGVVLLFALMASQIGASTSSDPSLDIVMEEDILLVASNEPSNFITKITVTQGSTTWVWENLYLPINSYANADWPDGTYYVEVERETGPVISKYVTLVH